MNKKEKNPSRCRDLRQFDRDIEDTIRQIKSKNETATSKANQLANELRGKRERFSSLEKAKIAAEVGSAIPGPQSGTAGAVATTLEIQLSILGSEINALETQLSIAKEEKHRWQQQHDQFTGNQRRNSEEMRQLLCVRAGF